MGQVPEKIEFAGGIFGSDAERLTVLQMLLETLGIDRVVRFGNPADWKAAVADLERKASARAADQEPSWSAEELTDDEWRRVVAHSLRDELNDPREDVYTADDGEPPHAAR